MALASDAKDKVVGAASEVGNKASETTQQASDKFSGVVRDAERALGKGEQKVENAAARAENALKAGETKVENAAERVKHKLEENPGPQGYLDAQRPRELRPETVAPKKPTYEGQTVYSGPALPVGHEPPPGFYIPPPPPSRVKDPNDTAKATLPLLAPKVKEFAASEPIVTQLASTIDSLASSLATPNSGEPNKILTRAQDDLSALTKRLADVKKSEKERLEKTVGEKTKEFEALLRSKEQERTKGEQGLRQGWEKEKAAMVDDWRGSLEKELESQRQGIEQR
jgi:mitofilin